MGAGQGDQVTNIAEQVYYLVTGELEL